MGLVLATTAAMIIWVVLWSIGVKAIDGFMVATVIITLAATGRMLKPYLPGRDDPVHRQDGAGRVHQSFGAPRLKLMHNIGMAWSHEAKRGFEQNLGVRLRVGPIKVDWTIEPISRDWEISAGLSLFR